MTTLNQLQTDFCNNILGGNKKAIKKHILINHINADARLNIYRNNILENLRHALELTFPSIWKLVGKECADNLAYAFVHEKANLPMSNCLDDWGGKFPQFLHDFTPIAHIVYLKDIAIIEWLQHLSYCASDYQPMDPAKLQNQLSKPLENLRIQLNPTAFLYSSPYSLQDIFNLLDNPEQQIELKLKPNYAVITRQNHCVVTHWVHEDFFLFILDIQNKVTLMQAYENRLAINPEFNLVEALQFMLLNDLLWKCN